MGKRSKKKDSLLPVAIMFGIIMSIFGCFIIFEGAPAPAIQLFVLYFFIMFALVTIFIYIFLRVMRLVCNSLSGWKIIFMKNGLVASMRK